MSREFLPHFLGCKGGGGSSPDLTHTAEKHRDEPSPPLFLNQPCLRYGVVLLPGLLAGCTRAPSFDIVGSFFPAWLVCMFLGILLAIFARWLLLRLKVAIVLPILVYPSVAALFTFLLWLIFFS